MWVGVMNDIDAQIEVGCIHYFKINPAKGALSFGYCIKCGEVKYFRNSIAADVDFTATETQQRKQVILKSIGALDEGIMPPRDSQLWRE